MYKACITMLARANPESERKMPRMIEGYRVVTEVTVRSMREVRLTQAKTLNTERCSGGNPHGMT
jgi:hypothetical protein